jgi:O-antigen/teichoic acid export membrane protein
LTSDIRTIGRHALVYGTGIAMGRLAGFIMLPIYTRFLTRADYGILELLTLTVDFIGTIAGVGLAAAVFKFYADAKDPTDKRRLISTAEITLVVLTLIACGAGLLASPVLGRAVLGVEGGAQYFRLFFVVYFLQAGEAIPLLYLRARNRSVAFVLLNVAKLVTALGLNIYFVVVLRLGVLGVLYSSLIAGTVFTTALSIYLVRAVGLGFSADKCRAMVRFGAPMVLWFLANFVLVFSDRYFLNHYRGGDSVGVYSLAYRFGMLISAFGFQPFNLVWAPQRFEIANRADGQDTIRRVFGYLSLLLGMAGVMVGLFAGEVIRIMAAPEFHAAARIVPVLIGGQILYHWVTFPNLSILITERTRVLGVLAVVTASIGLALNAVLIPRFGVMGAAIATLAAYAIRFTIVYVVAQRIHRFEYGWGFVTRAFVLFTGLMSIKLLAPISRIVPGLVLSSALAMLGIFVVYAWILDDRERRLLRELVAIIGERARGVRGRS